MAIPRLFELTARSDGKEYVNQTYATSRTAAVRTFTQWLRRRAIIIAPAKVNVRVIA